MVNAETGEASDLEDPLAGYSLFPFSLSNPLTNPSFESLLSNLKNMVVRNPDSLLKQARAIKDGSMDHLESDKTMATISEDKSVAPLTVNDKNPRVRPGLGLKPAKFTLKPLPSQPTGSQDFSIDVTKYEDPEELFRDFERMENARKEMLKLNGQPYKEIDLVDSSFVRRPRRPGLSVKPATYRHRTYSLTIPNNDEDRILSQKANDQSVTSPTREDTIPETNAVKFSPEPRAFDVKPAMSSKPSELDELLSYDYDGLDEDGVQKLLQEKLNIKLVDISNLPRPEVPDIRRRASFTKALPNMKDSIFHDNSKAASSKPRSFSYQFRKTSDNQVSPSRSKSPLASISTLNEQISRLNPLKDPFSLTDFDSSPEVICYPSGQNSKQADETRKRIYSHEAATSPPGMAGISHSDQLLTTNDSLEIRISPTCDKEDIGVSGEKWPFVMESGVSSRDDHEENLNEIRQLAQTNTMETMFEIRSPTDGEENLAVFGKGSLTGASKDVDSANVPIEEVQVAAGREPVGKEVFNEGSSMEKTSVDGGDGEMGVPLNTQGNLIEERKKKRAESLNSKRKEMEESTTMPPDNVCDENVTKGKKGKEKSNEAGLNDPKNKKRKVRGAPPLPNKVAGQLRKHSLSGDGTKWESGVRRSTRIRMRPLEFWRGERFLYGRVHESLVSVIGVKYASPAKDSEARPMKVKSYVSDEYKELIDLASSY